MTAAKKSKKRNFTSKPKEDKFVTKILENLDKVNAQDWEKYTNVKFTAPRNLFSQKAYQGFNLFTLYIDTLFNQFTSSNYATFNAISKGGGRLKKGAKGTVIEFFTFIYKNENTGQKCTDEQVKKMNLAQLQEIKKVACMQNYVVFNSNLIENLSEMNLNIEIEEAEELEFKTQDRCEDFISSVIKNGDLKIEYVLRSTGAYSPGMDKIIMPERKFFISEDKFYTTLFHEIIHWTGHENRINRDLKNSFNDQLKYSFEELIAEMGSMLLALQNGINTELINSIRYLKGWSDKNIENRVENIKNAFIQSKKAKKFLESL